MRTPTRLLFAIVALILMAFHPSLRGQPTVTVTVLHQFRADGAYPYAALIRGSDGNFYGTTAYGGSDDGTNNDGEGAVFQITPSGMCTTLHAFAGSAGADGAYPYAALVQARDGNFYGTTAKGGSGGGTVFRITPAGVESILYSFTSNGTHGAGPEAELIQGSDGNFYGTTYEGGSSNAGTVFRLTPVGVLTTLHNFGSGTGAHPRAGLVQGSDGNFYGTTAEGGSSNEGEVFQITPAGVLNILHSFTGTGTDGGEPEAGLVQGSDGNFYGTTYYDGTNPRGSNGGGTVFRITPAGTYTTLHTFADNGANGAFPVAGLVQGSDGNFYGTTEYGGSNYTGVVFQITSAGVYTTLHSFDAFDNRKANAGGALPQGGLVQGSDGSFYGTTDEGGSAAHGTVFRLATSLVITSADKAAATVGHAFSYQITATNDPTSYGATGLPAGLSVNAQTGVISGTPQKAGTYTLTLTAANGLGHDTATLTLTIAAAGTPYITSALTLEVPEDTDFSYRITATGSPTSFGVENLPRDITVDAKTGLITGKYHGVATLTLTLHAYNTTGKGSAYLTLSVYGAPVITSAASASGKDGQPFSYQITSSNHPTSFGVQNLASGLTVDRDTGLISGTHKGGRTSVLTLNAYNGAGQGSATLTLTFSVAPPVVTSATTATGKVGAAFSYQIAATNDPTSYGFQGDANGLTIDYHTGLISGTPKAAGTFRYTLNAYNGDGKGSSTLTLTITSS